MILTYLAALRHSTSKVVITCLILLLALPLAANLVAGETTLHLSKSNGKIWAEVAGTQLQLPDDAISASDIARITLPSINLLSVQPSSSSLYWQAGLSGFFAPVGAAGEWLQAIRPPSEWRYAEVSAASGTATYKLRAGRALALVPLSGSSPAEGEGVALVIRPERASIAWWTLDKGKPAAQLTSASYRPSGWVSLGDLLAELFITAWAGCLLLLSALLTGLVISRWRLVKAAPPAQPSPPATLAGRAILRLGAPSHVAIALFMAGTILAAAAGLVVLDGIPHVQDDVAYLFQARIFAHARSWVPAPPAPEFFQSGFVQIFDGRWFSKYPPGYPLLLAVGVWAGIPWLINALSAGVSLALIYMTGLRVFGKRVAAWAGLLGLASPWVVFMSGSYMSHPTTMMWVALFLYALVGLRLTRSTRGSTRSHIPGAVWGLLAGFAIGMAFITREWTALGIGCGAAVWALADLIYSRKEWTRRIVPYLFVVVGFLPPLLFLLYENHELTGSWLRLAQDLVGSYDTPGFGPGHGSEIGHTPAMGLYNGLVYLRTLATMFNGWPAPFALAPILLGAAAGARSRSSNQQKESGTTPARSWDALLWLMLAGLLGAYFLWWSSTTIYGPRYWYEGMPFMLLIAGRGLDLLGQGAVAAGGKLVAGARARRVQWLVPGGVLCLFAIYTLTQSFATEARHYANYNDISVDALRSVRDAHLTSALVFVALEPARANRDYGKVFFANDPLLGGSVLYARDRGHDANQYLAGLFPNRTPYWLPLQGAPQQGFGP